MDLKERIDINITDLVNRIDRLTSGNVGHSKNQLRFQIKKVGELVNELCESQKANTGDRQLTIPDVIKSVCPINSSIIIEKCIYRGDKCSVCIK